MFAVIARSVRKSQTNRPKNESVLSSSLCQNCDFLIKIWQNVGGWCCSSLGERSAFHWSEAFQRSHHRRRCLCSIIMHNWHLHACVNQSEHFFKSFFLFFSFLQGCFSCDLISPADWQSFVFISFYFISRDVGTLRPDWGPNATSFVRSLDPSDRREASQLEHLLVRRRHRHTCSSS